jgi:hypothetical protein
VSVGKLLKDELAAAYGQRTRDTAPRRHWRLRAGTAHGAVIAEFSTPLS